MNTNTAPNTFREALAACLQRRLDAGMTPAAAMANLTACLQAEAKRHQNLDHFQATGEWLS